MTTKKEDSTIKLSIVIPYHKSLKLTEELLNTLIPQLTKECELCIVDDDVNTIELDKYKSNNIKIIHHEVNSGNASKPRNTGIDNTTGKYLLFIDGDDNVAKNYVKMWLDKIKEEEFDYGLMSWETKDGTYKCIIKDMPPTDNTCVWNCCYSRKAIGNIRFNELKNIREDTEFNLKVRKGKKVNIEDILYIYNRDNQDSLTKQYSRGEIKENKEEVIKTQVVIFRSFLSIIGGIETAVYNACNLLKDYYDIIFIYDNCDSKQLRRIQRQVKCIKYTGQVIECDVLLLYGFNPKSVFNTVKANRVIQQICCNVKDVNYKYYHNNAITEFFADSEASAKEFMKQNPQFKCGTLHNLFNIGTPKKCLRIMTASRLSWEKGYDKMKAMAKRLNEKGYPFIWTVFTNDLPNEEIDGFIFMKPRLNVIDYMKGNDYGFQGSKSESWGNTPTEFLECGVPVIASEWASVREQIDEGINGYILKQDLSNLDEVIEKMYKNDLKGFKYEPKYSIKEWTNLIGDLGGKKDNYVYNEYPKLATVIIPSTYTKEGNRYYKKGDMIEIPTEERYDYLKNLGYIKEI